MSCLDKKEKKTFYICTTVQHPLCANNAYVGQTSKMYCCLARLDRELSVSNEPVSISNQRSLPGQRCKINQNRIFTKYIFRSYFFTSEGVLFPAHKNISKNSKLAACLLSLVNWKFLELVMSCLDKKEKKNFQHMYSCVVLR